jgi:hypothetical protein
MQVAVFRALKSARQRNRTVHPNIQEPPSLNTAGQVDALVQYNFKNGEYKSNKHVKAAVIGGLNLAIQLAYWKVTGGGVGTQMYRTTDEPREIIRKLR